MKTLISWMAYMEDFSDDGKSLNREGPHLTFYKYHLEGLDIDRHILLSNSDDDEMVARAKKLTYYLKEETNRFIDKKVSVENICINLKDPFDATEIYQRLDNFLIEHSSEKFMAMINTGTGDMQTVWYLLSSRYPSQLELLKVKHPKFSKNKEAGDLFVDVKLEEGILPSAFTLRSKSEETDFVDFQPEARARAIAVAASPDTTVLILGANGTGKESIAKTIHDNSIRKDMPYEVRNCAGFTDELLGAALFGHVKGAFTGAISNRPGIFEIAKGGTVFLDEIGDISPFMQINLLRVLQNKEIVPIGGSKVKKVDVRIIAATNQDLIKKCNEGTFRWDLFYRLAVAEIYTTSVSEVSVKEKKAIINHFVKEHFKKFKAIGRNKITLSKELMEILESYNFPGNIREIENLIESFYTYNEDVIQKEHLPKRIREVDWETEELLHTVTKRHIQKSYLKYNQNLTLTAKKLGVGSKNTILKYLER